jgi:hypothetical protein
MGARLQKRSRAYKYRPRSVSQANNENPSKGALANTKKPTKEGSFSEPTSEQAVFQ